MEVRNCSGYNPNFQARQLARTVNHVGKLDTKIDLWQVSGRDEFVLKRILRTTDMAKLMPEVPLKESKRWKEMLEIAVDDTVSKGTKSFLAVSEGKPCGIMSVVEGKNHFYTSCVCTWPIECGKKVKLAGKTLFYQLFKSFEDTKAKTISLKAIQDGPFETVPKYKSLGFNVSNYDRLVEMETNKSRVKQTCAKLDEMIDYVPVKDGKDENLFDVLKF